jgi:uncharacterized paraquat-inducible protein A
MDGGLALLGQHPFMLGGRRFLLAGAVLAAGVLLALGFHLPFMRLSTLVLIGHGPQEHSLISAVHTLVRSNAVFLGGVVLALAIFLPLLKLLYLVLLAVLPGSEIARAEALAWLGRWWPQDLVALGAAAVLVASRETLMQRVAGGAYCFAAAVLAMALAYAWRRGDGRTGALPAPKSLDVTSRGHGFGALVALAALAFALGVTLPVVRLAGAGSSGQSIIDLVLALRTRGEMVLWVVLAILALALPGLRLLYLVTVAAAGFLPSRMGAMAVRCAEVLGPNATTDTMVLSLGLFYLIHTRAVEAALQPAVYCLAAAAALMLAAYAWVNLPAATATGRPSRLQDKLAAMTAPAKEAGNP